MQTITTDVVKPAERLAFWQETVCSGLVRVDCKATTGFSGNLQLGATGRISVADLNASRHRVERSRRAVSPDDDDCAILFLQLDRAMGVVVDNTEYMVPPGALFLYDMHSPIQLRFAEEFRHLAFRAPWSQWFPDRPEMRCSALISSSSPLLRVAAAAAAALFEDNAGIDGGSGIDGGAGSGSAIRAVVNLLAETICESMPMPDASPAERALTGRFERLLEERLEDAALTADELARTLGVTPQYLNRVLTRSGASISRRILTRRLSRCAHDLRRFRSMRISEAAFRWGFNDLSHFSRAFRAFYGVSPSDYHAAHAAC